MIRFLYAVATALTVGGIAGLRHFRRWLRANTTLPVEVPDYLPVGVVAAVEAQDGWL